MPRVVVHLLDGFDHDDVVLRLNGQPAARSLDVSTQLLLGTAGQLEAEVPGDRAQVMVEVPGRGLSASHEAGPAPAVDLLASIEGTALTLRRSEGAPGFL